jgi:hypothetical protein
LLIFLPLVQTVFSLVYIFIGVCGFLGNSLIVLAAVRYYDQGKYNSSKTVAKNLAFESYLLKEYAAPLLVFNYS